MGARGWAVAIVGKSAGSPKPLGRLSRRVVDIADRRRQSCRPSAFLFVSLPAVTRPLVVFSHANGFPAGTYRKFFSFLEPHVEIRALDMYGHDPRFPVRDNWHQLAEELLAFVDAQCDRPAFLLGHSMGAVLSFIAAYHRPEKFRGLVMMDPPLINGAQGLAFQVVKCMGRGDSVTPAGKSKNRRSHWPSREVAITELSRKKLFSGVDPDCVHDYVHSVTEPQADGEFHLRFLVAQEVAIFRTTPTDYWRYWRRLRVPGVLMTGEQTEVTRPDAVLRMCLRHRMSHVTTSGGHLFPLQHPEQVARQVLMQLEQLAKQAITHGR